MTRSKAARSSSSGEVISPQPTRAHPASANYRSIHSRPRLPPPETHKDQVAERVLTEAQLAVLFRDGPGTLRIATLLRAAAEGGLRRGEIIGRLRWDDMDLGAPPITLAMAGVSGVRTPGPATLAIAARSSRRLPPGAHCAATRLLGHRAAGRLAFRHTQPCGIRPATRNALRSSASGAASTLSASG